MMELRMGGAEEYVNTNRCPECGGEIQFFIPGRGDTHYWCTVCEWVSDEN